MKDDLTNPVCDQWIVLGDFNLIYQDTNESMKLTRTSIVASWDRSKRRSMSLIKGD